MSQIIKDKITLSDYINYKENNTLYNRETDMNNKLKQEKQNKELFNLSIKQIKDNFSITLIKMMNEIVDLIHSNNSNNLLLDIFMIITKDDRLIYTGIFFILLSFLFYFMDISN